MINNAILNQDRSEFVSNQVIIKFNPKTAKKMIKNYHNGIDAVVVEENKLLGFQVISSAKSINELLSYYRNLQEIEYVRPNFTVHIA